MIIATHTPTNTLVQVVEWQDNLFLVQTLHGERPFQQHTCREDPETPPASEFVDTTWTWAGRGDLADVIVADEHTPAAYLRMEVD